MTNKDIFEWFNNLQTVQTQKKKTGYNSYIPEKPLEQFQIDLTHMHKPWNNAGNIYAYSMC